MSDQSQFLLYTAPDGVVKVDVFFKDETVWLTQAQMAELFQTTIPNVSMHIRNVFAEGELQADSVVKEFLTTAADGKSYAVQYYNLDAVIAVGYRVNSLKATHFRMPEGEESGMNVIATTETGRSPVRNS